MSDLNNLADRVEALDGPSREIDAEIAVALGWQLVRCSFQNMNGSTECTDLWRSPNTPDDDWDAYKRELAPEIASGFWPDSEPPRCTASLDAAMSLVPEGRAWTVGNQIKGSGDGWMATVGICKARAPTPALALVAASLRAIAQGEQS